jgi:hypothetical protein
VDERWATDASATFIALQENAALRVRLVVVDDDTFCSSYVQAEAEYIQLSAAEAAQRTL